MQLSIRIVLHSDWIFDFIYDEITTYSGHPHEVILLLVNVSIPFSWEIRILSNRLGRFHRLTCWQSRQRQYNLAEIMTLFFFFSFFFLRWLGVRKSRTITSVIQVDSSTIENSYAPRSSINFGTTKNQVLHDRVQYDDLETYICLHKFEISNYFWDSVMTAEM